ncbi:MAG TPA: type II toxin-antitoxin system ParD family antitoxin [Humisphaera sp.]|jgi:antitoxin ParD1/3/4|nr:type II toxin-antitoxin system ParD family antitoxin [Humisphaera sp.]
MNVSLSTDLERFVKGKVKSGRYASASEVVTRALRLLREEDRIRTPNGELMPSAIQRGIEQADRGETARWDSEQIKKMGRRLLVASRSK